MAIVLQFRKRKQKLWEIEDFSFILSTLESFDIFWSLETSNSFLSSSSSFFPSPHSTVYRVFASYLGTCLRVLCCAMFSHVQFFVSPWTIARQAPLSMEFSREEYWSGLPCPPPGDLPDPGIELTFPDLQADSLSLSHREAHHWHLGPGNSWEWGLFCVS